MRLFANMVVRNEADRYLQSCLEWLEPQVDGIFVGDDRSDDDTVNVAIGAGAVVYTRGKDEPSFLKEEGTFRSICWNRMVEVFNPGPEDWILGIDADEFAVGKPLRQVAEQAHRRGCISVNVRIPEIFLLDPFSQRVDGYWGGIVGTRLTRFVPGDQKFRQPQMGSGVLPAYSYAGMNWNERNECGIRLLHLGYACEADRKNKYERYTSIVKNGHADSHIQSIMQTPKLQLWDGDIPNYRRGIR